MKRTIQPLFFSIKDHKTKCTCRIGMVTAPIFAHGFGDTEFYSAPTGIIIGRLGRDSFSIVVATDHHHLLSVCRPWYADLYIERGNSGGTSLPAIHMKWVAAHLW